MDGKKWEERSDACSNETILFKTSRSNWVSIYTVCVSSYLST